MKKPLYGEALRMVEDQAGKILVSPAQLREMEIPVSLTLANLAADYFKTLDPDLADAMGQEIAELIEFAALRRARKLCAEAALQSLCSIGSVRGEAA